MNDSLIRLALENDLDPELVTFARFGFRMGFCEQMMCSVTGFTHEQFRRITRDCKQGDKEFLMDKVEV